MRGDPLEVRLVRLEPMRIARTLAYGEEPETMAWNKMIGWAHEHGLLAGTEKPRFFGFDNPGPSAGRSSYGYEVWITVGPETEPEVEIGIGIGDFPGGLYAVTRYERRGGKDLKKAWNELVAWVKKSSYRPARRQWLEEVVGFPGLLEEELILDLYLPVRE